ncbi:hypothetical protein [Lutispora saccharofermentans]|uniref:TetR family transcriptional regulator n=1 Tax=Lutispora saccharofermentans TaxID=3024236 RepID=A0ABT1NKJ5_9FIRM|nr:hypothetical protein [Lutispora saccharofermentans]MCQ1531109.1 hypothetical protein [Lutispora saccharofermentans]
MSYHRMGYSRKETAILEAALSIAFTYSLDALNIRTLSERIMLPEESIHLLYESDNHLRLSAMNYAAFTWCNRTKQKLLHIENQNDRIKTLIKEFAAGTVGYSQSLSSYIDAWKMLRDMNRESIEEITFFRQSLFNIYEAYVDLFISTIKGEGLLAADHQAEINALAWIMVVISDGLHIQSLLQTDSIDMESIINTIYKMVITVLKEVN